MCMQCQSSSLALQLSGQVFLLQRISNMSRSHTYTLSHTHTAQTHTFQMMAICSATFHWGACVNSNQRSRHSGTERIKQLLVSTGKCLYLNFLCFVSDANVSVVFGFSFSHGLNQAKKNKTQKWLLMYWNRTAQSFRFKPVCASQQSTYFVAQ